MKKLLYLGFAFLIGCSQSKKKNSVETYSRQLIVYDLDSLVRTNNYELTKVEKDSSIAFIYKNLEDSTKNMVFDYSKYKEEIYFGPEQFELTEKEFLNSDINFDRYEPNEPIPDGMGNVLFNTHYGVLAFDNGWGMQFHYLTEENSKNLQLPLIFKIE
ncbi:hypothetical protein FEE95_22035 [Maribacter algarum]|uniref:Lipoprotein n=1 Tax=Maribacter algarum (ex Zhang et al. 2020) TaxID=2578118 RepID=A0A5S3PDJ6_9FLAO|nr:hypothetical protein FEE95_22035 [Maribacter algarum]